MIPQLDIVDTGEDVVEQKMNTFDYSVTGMPPRYYGVTFDKFPNAISDKVREFSLHGSGPIVLEGSNGTGKTVTLCASFYERYINGLTPGLYLSCKYTVCPMIRSSRSFAAKVNEMDMLLIYYNTPFLILDEVGKGDDKILERNFVSCVLSARYDRKLKTGIGTNMSTDELCTWLGEDINSRFHETAIALVLDGKDWRNKNDEAVF